MNPTSFLSGIPQGLRDPLITEYNEVLQRYLEGRWTAAELSGGKFSEIVYTILDGHAKGVYSAGPSKPPQFVDACRSLEKNTHVPRSFQILIPRILPALYEVRNNRNVGHVGGDVNPNAMDSLFVVSTCSWVMGELVRVFHNVNIADAQKMVDLITGRKVPLIFDTGHAKRVLRPAMKLSDQIILLVGSSSAPTNVSDLVSWIEHKDGRHYIKKVLGSLHKARLVEYSKAHDTVMILPPGVLHMEKIISAEKIR